MPAPDKPMKLIMAIKHFMEDGSERGPIVLSEMSAFKNSLSQADRNGFARELIALGYNIEKASTTPIEK